MEEGGGRWKAWSSRLVSATLKVGNGSRDRLLLSFLQPMKQQCATAGLGSETFKSRHGSTPSLGIGIALTMSSCGRPTGGSVWMSR